MAVLAAYPPSTPLARIIQDGWAMGFSVNQTLEEARACNYEVTREDVLSAWKHEDEVYERYCQQQNLETDPYL